MLFAPESQINARVDSETYPLGEKSEHRNAALALLALTHTSVEHRLYVAMLNALDGNGGGAEGFTARRLMALTDIRSLSTIRRGLEGLVSKLSIQREGNGKIGRKADHVEGLNGTAYRVNPPEQIIAKRRESGVHSYETSLGTRHTNISFERAIGRVLENRNLSRREAQVALCCAEGLTNAEIGQRLQVAEQTVKFHLRHVYIKFAVKRRAELISRLLM